LPLGLRLLLVPTIEIVAKNHGGRHSVQQLTRATPGAPAGFTRLLHRLPTAQAFIGQLHRAADVLAQALGESGGFAGHVAKRAVQANRPTHDNPADAVLPAKVPDSRQVAPAVCALPYGQRPRRNAERIGKSQSQPPTPVINRQYNALRGGSSGT
jgi:hypothetical protein